MTLIPSAFVALQSRVPPHISRPQAAASHLPPLTAARSRARTTKRVLVSSRRHSRPNILLTILACCLLWYLPRAGGLHPTQVIEGAQVAYDHFTEREVPGTKYIISTASMAGLLPQATAVCKLAPRAPSLPKKMRVRVRVRVYVFVIECVYFW